MMLSTVFSPSGLFSLKRSGSDDANMATFFLASPSPAPGSNILNASSSAAPSSSSLFSPLQMHAFAQQAQTESSASSTLPMMMQHASSSIPMPMTMDLAPAESQPQQHPTLRFTAGPSAASSSIGAFNFAAAAATTAVKQPVFIVDIPSSSQLQRSASAPHHNPELLEGFLLDGGCAAMTHTPAPASAEGKRKRKETSAPSSAASEESSSSSAAGLSKKARRHGTSLNDSRSSSPSVSSSAAETLAHKSTSVGGATSPLLELLQQSNQSLVQHTGEAGSKGKASKKERAEMRRHKAAMKLLRLEASIARLTEEVTQTKAQEQAATQLAAQMAKQAEEAAQFASMHAAQRQEEMAMGRMIDSFLVGDNNDESASVTLSCAGEATTASSSDLSLPPLSPVALTAMAPHSLRVGVGAASLSSSSVSEEVDLSECSTPTDAVASRMMHGSTTAAAAHSGSPVAAGCGSPVQSLDDAIDAALLQAKQVAGGATEDLVAHVQGLAWAEQARSIRAVQYALHAALDAHEVPSAGMGCFASPDLALRFAESDAGLCCGANDPAVRSALVSLAAECGGSSQGDSDVESAELQHTLAAFTSAFLAKQRASSSMWRARDE